jgi:pimeloyl-ACP methyl ester carboxylesterase
LEELGSKPCEGIDGLTCLSVSVPLDHFDPANPETIDIVFAVAPATGERKGMYVQAFGGPGSEGLSRASRDFLPEQIQQHYDIVFFDQRGLGRSHPLECKDAYAAYFLHYLYETDNTGEEGYDTTEEQQAAIQNAKSFVDQCVAEIGIDPSRLRFFTTDQVAEDIESFRQAIGDDQFMLYGVSYGTAVAQAYARAHADHLAGLILNGTQDTTLSGDEIAFSQWEAFNTVLLEVFKACDADPGCSAMLDGNSQAAYDELARKLAEAPIVFHYSFPVGKKVQHNFTLHMLDYTVTYLLYGLNSRMELMRALAAAHDGDIFPMAELFFQVAKINSATGEYFGDPNFSDTLYYIVWCGDDPYYSGTPEERSARLMQAGQKLNGLVPRLDLDVLSLGLTCPFWPSAPAGPVTREPLKATGVPTFVLNATLDPATPFHEGKTVFGHLDLGFHLYVNGGGHGIYRRGFPCPDRYIEDFLVNGNLPAEHEIACDWGEAVIARQ